MLWEGEGLIDRPGELKFAAGGGGVGCWGSNGRASDCEVCVWAEGAERGGKMVGGGGASGDGV